MSSDVPQLSLAKGIPLAEETDIGALTLGEYIREVKQRFNDNEAAVITITNVPPKPLGWCG